MKAHAARALHQRFHDDTREFLGVALETTRKSLSALLTLWQLDDVVLGQKVAEPRMHAVFGIADRHRPGRVAVIATSEGKEFLSLAHALVQPELHRHLHGDFDRDRARLREEDAGQIGREASRKPTSKRERLLVSEPAEHDVRHQRELVLDCIADIGMVITVTGGPPRRDSVDQLAPITEHDAGAMRARHGQRRSHRLHLRIGQPDVGEPGLIPRRPRSSLISLFSRHWALSMQSLRT